MEGENNQSSLEREDVTVVNTGRARQSIVVTALGNAMEWFDFGIYSYLAVTIWKVFFSEMNGSLQLVYSFAVFAISFLVRPVGGMVFGMLGDRIGRKKILTITIIMMALSTLSIGFIPGYQTIGITATLLLLLARLVQGFSTGGEYSGAITYIAESTPDKKRTRLSSGLEVGTLIGYIFGSGIVTLLTFLIGNHAMTAWGWRIPFFVAAPIGLIGRYLRTNLKELLAYETMDEEIDQDKRVSMKDIMIHHRKPLWTGVISVFFYNVADIGKPLNE